MAIISTRIDDSIKLEAESIADNIGIPLSTAINIFIRKFIHEKGFPFNVTAPHYDDKKIIDEVSLDTFVKEAISNPNNKGLASQFTYVDPNTQEIITVKRKD